MLSPSRRILSRGRIVREVARVVEDQTNISFSGGHQRRIPDEGETVDLHEGALVLGIKWGNLRGLKKKGIEGKSNP